MHRQQAPGRGGRHLLNRWLETSPRARDQAQGHSVTGLGCTGPRQGWKASAEQVAGDQLKGA